jgi:F-type H+-transporting ATPase subunit delta
MNNRAVAARFARALFDVSRAADPERTGRELNGFVNLVGNHPELLRTLTSAALPPAVKTKIIAELLKLQPLAGPLGRILNLLAERDQLALLPLIADAYQQRLLDYQQVVRAQVTTAVALSPDRAAALEQSLSAATGKRVVVTTDVDPSIIGGVIAKIGSRVYNGSVAHHLTRVKAQLVAAAQ